MPEMELLYAINDALLEVCKAYGIDICDEHLNDATHAAGAALSACKGVGRE
jgi:hypothetical protein